MKLYDRIFPPKVIELPNGKQILKYRSRAPLAVLVILFLTALSVKYSVSYLTPMRVRSPDVTCGSMSEMTQ